MYVYIYIYICIYIYIYVYIYNVIYLEHPDKVDNPNSAFPQRAVTKNIRNTHANNNNDNNN